MTIGDARNATEGVPYSALSNERFEQPFSWTRDYVAPDELADLLRGRGPGFERGTDAADVALDNGRDVRPANADTLDDLHVSGFGHGVGGFDEADEALGFNKSDC